MKRCSKIKKNLIIPELCIIAMFLAPWNGIFINNYLDDIVPLFFFLEWMKWVFSVKKRNCYYAIFGLLILICVIGVFSNYIAAVNTSVMDIISDMYSFLKMFFVFLGGWAFFSKNRDGLDFLIKQISLFAKIFICIGFVFAVLNLSGLYIMSEQVRFGINTFSFIYGNASQYGILVGASMAFVIMHDEKRSLLYELLATFIMLMTFKGMSLIIIVVYWLLIFARVKKVKLRYIVIIGMVLCFVLRYQIGTYLLDGYAPRAMLLRFGAITANKYFPFGAGFGSFGSAVAAKHYSPLYVLYGFTERRSLIYIPGEATALMDAYLGMSLGQYGWIGTILLAAVFIMIGLKLLKVKTNNYKCKNICISLYVCICGMAVMAGSLKTAVGQIMLLIIALFLAKNN